MKVKVDSLPDWTFDITEVSPNVYRVEAEHPSGARVDLTGTNPDILVERAKESAHSIEKELDRLRHREADGVRANLDTTNPEDHG